MGFGHLGWGGVGGSFAFLGGVRYPGLLCGLWWNPVASDLISDTAQFLIQSTTTCSVLPSSLAIVIVTVYTVMTTQRFSGI